HGAYEKITALAWLKIDPKAPENQGITDIALAQRDADGLVRYDTDLIILRPIDGRKARRVLVYDVVNRGIKTVGMLNGGAIGLTDPIDKGDALLMRQGVTVVWSGWQGDFRTSSEGPQPIGGHFPLLTGKAGPVTGRTSTETIFDRADGKVMRLPYPALTLDQGKAMLTVQAVTGSPKRVIPPAQWRYLDDGNVEVTRPADMDAGAIYHFEYVAKDPKLFGLGFAATRDLVAFLRHGSAAEGNPLADIASAPCDKTAVGACANPAGGAFASAIAWGVSQSGRYLRDYLYQGFNRDTSGLRVFDGVMAVIPGARRTFTNYRFAEPGRFSRQHEDHDVPGFSFPYAYSTLRDPVTGRTDGILRACEATQTCPKLMHFDTSGEFWQAGASLVGTGGTGHDVPFPPNVRAYMLAGGAHAPGLMMPACRYPANPMLYSNALRALFLAMVDWTLDRQAPPPSRWPSLAKGELVPPASLRGPAGITWAKVINEPIPPAGKPAWPIFVPAIDADGNDLPGIRPPQVAAPVGTLLGWNLRKAGYGEGDLCLLSGTFLPFAADRAARGSDPRLSLAERYPAGRETELRKAADALVAARLLLPEDAEAAVRNPEGYAPRR
ncbi:MAG: alpha/beta hydrolase domain-containing protein, partial [Novosphingobium sp.]